MAAVPVAGGTVRPSSEPNHQGRPSARIPARALASAAYPLTITDPVISAEQPASDAVVVAAPAAQGTPAVAASRKQYLVVWEDFRSGTGDIFGARVSAGGVILDPGGIRISASAGDQRAPVVAWNGTSFLVAWTDERSGGFDVYAARVSSKGAVLDPKGIPVSAGPGGQAGPAIAWNGSSYLIAWGDTRGADADIYAARVSSAGAVQDSNGIPISTAAGHQGAPACVWNGSSYLIAWGDARGADADVYAARVSSSGAIQDPNGIPVSTAAGYQSSPEVSWNGTNHLLAWEDYRVGPNHGSYDVFGARVDGNGVVLDPGGIAIAASAGHDERTPTVASNGVHHFVAWQDNRSSATRPDIYGARVASTGAIVDPAGFRLSSAVGTESAPAVSWSGSDYLVSWEDFRSGADLDVYGVRVTAAAKLHGLRAAISTVATSQDRPAVAWDGTNYLVVWEDSRASVDCNLSVDCEIRAARISPTGRNLDGGGIVVSPKKWPRQFSPDVTWNGTSYLVVWHDRRSGADYDIYGARVSAAGVVQDPGGIAISTAVGDETLPALTWNGSRHLVVWQSGGASGTTGDVYGTRVTPAGVVLDVPALAISTAPSFQSVPAVAWDGTNHLVVWHDRRFGINSDIYGARVSPLGAVLDANGFAISTATGPQFLPTLAWGGAEYLVVWSDPRSGGDCAYNTPSKELPCDVFGARVSPSGVVLDPSGLAISIASGSQSEPVVSSNGVNYVVAWREVRPGANADLRAARVRTDGSLIDPAGFALSAGASDELEPALTAGPPGAVSVAYDRWAPGPKYGAQRVFVRTVE